MKKALFISDRALLKSADAGKNGCPLFRRSVFRSLYHLKNKIEYELLLLDTGLISEPEIITGFFSNEAIYFEDIIRVTSEDTLKSFLSGKQGVYDLAASYLVLDSLAGTILLTPENIRTIALDEISPEQDRSSMEIRMNKSSSKSMKDNIMRVPDDLRNKNLSEENIDDEWIHVVEIVSLGIRTAFRERVTNESEISVKIDLDGSGESKINTGIGFFDHLLTQLSRHSGIDLEIKAVGDIHVDEHHTIEDTAITLGETFYDALGSKRGMERYGFALPMDDCMAQVLVDFGGRPWLVWDVTFSREKIGDMPTEMFMHFFKSFSDAAKCNLNISAGGVNEHHKIEAIFKAMAKSIRMALKRNAFEYTLPTTKGML